jgi:cob(I)alamin adenosyltransferase
MELERDGQLEASVGQDLLTQLGHLQNQLFDVGADLCVPGAAGERLRIPEDYVLRLEEWVAQWNGRLTPLESFVLPAGSPATCQLHHARTVCRRVERAFLRLQDVEGVEAINPRVGIFLNRLSDLLFVMARAAAGPAGERLWQPGG